MKQSQSFLHGDVEPIVQVQEGIKRQLMGHGPDLMIVKVWFEEGAEGYVHEHYHSQGSYVASGEFEVMVNGEKQVLKSGDAFHVQPHQDHGAVCLKAGVLIDVFSPLREDFLDGE